MVTLQDSGPYPGCPSPLTNILELFNSGAEEILSDQVAKAVESAVTLLGNASCHISSLRRTKVLKEYNKDLVTWGQDCKAEFLKLALDQNSPRMPTLTRGGGCSSEGQIHPVILVSFSERPAIRIARRVLLPAVQASAILLANETPTSNREETPCQEREVTITGEPEPSNHICMYASSIIKCKSYLVKARIHNI